MPGMRCTVAVCNNSFVKTKSIGLNITYHQFPKNKNLRKIWIQRCHRTGNWNPNSCHICSIHFTPEDYKHNPYSYKRRLKPTAVPTQYLTVAPDIPGMKKSKKRHCKYIYKNEIIDGELISNNDANIVEYDNYNSYYQSEYIDENEMNYEFMKQEIVEEDQAETVEIKYSEILAKSQNNFTDIMDEIYTKEATTQTENDHILQTCNFLVQKNIQLENKLKQLEMKLTRLENFMQNSQIK